MAQNKDLVADAQTILEENLSEKKSVESARRLIYISKNRLYVMMAMYTVSMSPKSYSNIWSQMPDKNRTKSFYVQNILKS